LSNLSDEDEDDDEQVEEAEEEFSAANFAAVSQPTSSRWKKERMGPLMLVVRSSVSSCRITATPSRVNDTSNSIRSTPSSWAWNLILGLFFTAGYFPFSTENFDL
jgi:hypothetical protein